MGLALRVLIWSCRDAFFLVYLCDNVLLAGSGELCCWGLGELMIVSISFSG